MPTIRPFQAWRYQPLKAGPLKSLITPPYDVISPEQRRQMAAASAYSFVHLILPEARGGEDVYQAAARHLKAWQGQGILEQDPRPAFTVHRQSYSLAGGERLSRTGLLALMDLPDTEASDIRPHEHTMAGPRRDRTRLMLAVRAHLSPIFMLVEDADGAFQKALDGLAAAASGRETFTDAQGQGHEVCRHDHAPVLAEISGMLQNRQMIIADGHHRYESAQACRRLLAEESGVRPEVLEEAGRIPVELVSLASPGLTVLPIHRTVTGLPGFNGSRLLEALRQNMRIDSLPRASANSPTAREDLRRLVAAGGPGCIGLALGESLGYHVLHGPPLAAGTAPLDSLDVTLLHQGILHRQLGIDVAAVEKGGIVDFHKDLHHALDAVADGAAQAAFILNATSLVDLRRVTAAREIMPQKSTFFYPKVPAGLVVHAFGAPAVAA